MSKQSFFDAASSGFSSEKIELFGEKFLVRTMSAGAKDRFDIEHSKSGGRHFRARLVAASTFDEAGEPVFDERDHPRLSALPAHALEPLVEAALRVNRMGQDDAEATAKN